MQLEPSNSSLAKHLGPRAKLPRLIPRGHRRVSQDHRIDVRSPSPKAVALKPKPLKTGVLGHEEQNRLLGKDPGPILWGVQWD